MLKDVVDFEASLEKMSKEVFHGWGVDGFLLDAWTVANDIHLEAWNIHFFEWLAINWRMNQIFTNWKWVFNQTPILNWLFGVPGWHKATLKYRIHSYDNSSCWWTLNLPWRCGWDPFEKKKRHPKDGKKTYVNLKKTCTDPQIHLEIFSFFPLLLKAYWNPLIRGNLMESIHGSD